MGTCKSCKTCGLLEVASTMCTEFADTVCSQLDCSKVQACEAGKYRSSCIAVGDTIQTGSCLSCTYTDPTQCPTGHFLDFICNTEDNPQADNRCIPCNQYDNCDAGKHVSEGNGAICSQVLKADVICNTVCNVCDDTEYESQTCSNQIL
jgi:hypothetical protein